MKFTNYLAAGALLLGSSAAYATPITVGGVTYDPIANGGMAGAFKFQQWYADASSYTTDVDGITTLLDGNAVTPGAGFLTGVGLFDEIEFARNLFGNIGFPSELNYCTGCVLTFSFGGLVAQAPSASGIINFNTSQSWLNVYFQEPIPFTSVNANSYLNVNGFQNGPLWASMKFDRFWLDGSILGGRVQSTLSVTGGMTDVVNALDRHDGQSDIFLQGIASIDGLRSSAASGQFESIPAPASLAILGLGLLGLAGSRRFKKA